MSGVFLSYSRADRALADQIIRGLRALEVVVWWDEDMRGVDWQEELEQQITELAGVVVLWTPNSVNSKHVRDEARLGLDTDKLVNVIEGVPKPPFPYDRINALPLDGWTGREPHHGWTRLVETIEEKVVATGGAKPGEIAAALARREEEVRLIEQAFARAQSAFQDAQSREGDAAEAAAAAQAALDSAEEQHQRVVETRATPAVQRTAQQELDETRAAKGAADQAHRAVRAELSEASRGLTRAEAALERLFAESVALQSSAVSATPPALALATDLSPTAAVRPAAARRARTPWLAAAGVALLAVVFGGAFLLLRHGSSGAATTRAAAQSAAAPVASAAVAPPDLAADAVRAAAALEGAWAPQGQTCASPVTISIRRGALLMTVAGETSATVIDPSPAPGVIAAHDGDAGKYTYALDRNDTLSVAGPAGPIMAMTRCAG